MNLFELDKGLTPKQQREVSRVVQNIISKYHKAGSADNSDATDNLNFTTNLPDVEKFRIQARKENPNAASDLEAIVANIFHQRQRTHKQFTAQEKELNRAKKVIQALDQENDKQEQEIKRGEEVDQEQQNVLSKNQERIDSLIDANNVLVKQITDVHQQYSNQEERFRDLTAKIRAQGGKASPDQVQAAQLAGQIEKELPPVQPMNPQSARVNEADPHLPPIGIDPDDVSDPHPGQQSLNLAFKGTPIRKWACGWNGTKVPPAIADMSREHIKGSRNTPDNLYMLEYEPEWYLRTFRNNPRIRSFDDLKKVFEPYFEFKSPVVINYAMKESRVAVTEDELDRHLAAMKKAGYEIL